MNKKKSISYHQGSLKRGRGVVSSTLNLFSKPIAALVNKSIDLLPVELHLPGGYQYCGPGTKLRKRLQRGDPGINKLDQACKQHDISYSKYSDSAHRSVADKILAEKAWERVKSSDAGLGERAAALAVTAAMKGKTAFGGGRRKKRGGKRISKKKRGGNIKRKRSTRKVKPSVWSMIKKGQGLYLRPYRVY